MRLASERCPLLDSPAVIEYSASSNLAVVLYSLFR